MWWCVVTEGVLMNNWILCPVVSLRFSPSVPRIMLPAHIDSLHEDPITL